MSRPRRCVVVDDQRADWAIAERGVHRDDEERLDAIKRSPATQRARVLELADETFDGTDFDELEDFGRDYRWQR